MSEHERVIDLSVEVPGTPEQVWRAIATGPGISSWFIPHDVEERAGGSVTMDFGTFGVEHADVVEWEPPHRVVFTGRGERALAYEWLVEAKDGGTCVVRLVNSGFGAGDDWDADFDGMSEGWKTFMQNLRLHLTYFAGRTAEVVQPLGMTTGPNPDAFARLCGALGVAPDLAPGSPFVTGGDGIPRLAGRVESVLAGPRARAYLLLLDDPLPGTGFVTAEGDGDHVMVSTYLYLYGDGVAGIRDAWAEAFAHRFPAPDLSGAT